MPYLGKSPQHGNYSKLTDFSGDFDGSDATHAIASNGIAITPVRPEALIISINGVIQEPVTDYTVSGTNITFTTAPTAGDNFFGIAMGEQLQIGTPSDATVTSAKLTGNLVTPGTLDVNGQELILDADGDTTITADTDDQIDIKIAGADDFQFTANTFTAAASSVVALDDGAVATPALTNTGDLNTGIYFPAADTVGVTAGGTEQFRFGSNPIPGGSKNLLINGSMAVAQRGSQTGQGGSSAYSACDRWFVLSEGSPQGRVTTTQTADTGMNLNGHEYTLKVDCTTAEDAVGAAECIVIQQKIEAQNLQGLKYGTANAEEVTLSFWFSSPKTGIHGAGIYLSDTGYSQVKEFTIASANTWEYFALTFSANTSNKINNDTGSGLIVSFPLVAGSNFQVSANAWASGDDFTTSNQQNLLDNTSNNVSLAGVQLEVGSVATDFAYEDIGTTLHKCQRYFERRNYADASDTIAPGVATTAGVSTMVLNFQEKRTTPTFGFAAATTYRIVDKTNSIFAGSNIAGGAISPTTATVNLTHNNATTGGAYFTAVSTTYIDIIAEL
jgi:hypothetical protein